MKPSKLILLLPILTITACEKASDSETKDPAKPSDSAAPAVSADAATPPPATVLKQDPKEKYNYYFEATFSGGEFDGQTFRGEVGGDPRESAFIRLGRDGSSRGDLRVTSMKFGDSASRGYVSLTFEGDIEKGKAETSLEGNPPVQTGSIGTFSISPGEDAEGGISKFLIFKTTDLEFTEVTEWEPFEKNFQSGEFRNVSGKATVEEYWPEPYKNTPVPDATIEITFMAPQERFD